MPGDPSSAAFPLVAALITPGSAVTVEGVLLNPLRTGLFVDPARDGRGPDASRTSARTAASWSATSPPATRALHGVEVPAERAPSMIDEYPILAVAAALPTARPSCAGIGELRVKESDRLRLMAAGLAACGVGVEEEPETLTVAGIGPRPTTRCRRRPVATHGDHRIAMCHLVLGLAAEAPVSVDEPGMIATSFPGFVALMDGLGAGLIRGVSGFVIAVDGPAASGKGTIATGLAARYGLPMLDTGLLYRAVGVAVAKAGGDLDDPAVAGAAARALDPRPPRRSRLPHPRRPARPPAGSPPIPRSAPPCSTCSGAFAARARRRGDRRARHRHGDRAATRRPSCSSPPGPRSAPSAAGCSSRPGPEP